MAGFTPYRDAQVATARARATNGAALDDMAALREQQFQMGRESKRAQVNARYAAGQAPGVSFDMKMRR